MKRFDFPVLSRRRLLGVAVTALAANAVQAQTFTRPVRFVVPYPPGGSADRPARLLAAQLGRQIGQQVIVDNRGGAGGAVGAAEVARAAPDGYTLLMSSSALAISSALSRSSRLDPLKDFRHAAIFATVPSVIVANPARVPQASWADFVKASKEAPGKYAFASAGPASPAHLAAELLAKTFGVQWLHVPYKGSGPALQDLLAGQIDFSVVGLSSALPHIRAGSLKALAVAEKTRLPQLPQVPAIAETVPGYEFSTWFGVSAPAGTPAEIVARIDQLVRAAIADSETRSQIAEAGAQPVYVGASAMVDRLTREIADFRELGRRTGISLD